jgi:hypothetical protein
MLSEEAHHAALLMVALLEQDHEETERHRL